MDAQRTVISASRRTDLPRCFPAWLANGIRAGEVEVPAPYGGPARSVSLRPADVHSIVLWSKDYRRLLADDAGLRDALGRYAQVFCHFTITGLGGTFLEPEVPPWRDALAQLPALIEFAGHPERVRVRFDPVVHWVEAGEVRSNLGLAEPVFAAVAAAELRTVTASLMSPYGKIMRRGPSWYEPPPEERAEICGRLVETARRHGLALLACSDPVLTAAGARPASCIDGALLARLHPDGLPAPVGKDKGQRPACSCTPSQDIGSYRQRCPNGCRYCYANPTVPGSTNGHDCQD